MNLPKTITLNLPEKEMAVLEELCEKKDLTKTALLRQALRTYQLIEHYHNKGIDIFDVIRRLTNDSPTGCGGLESCSKN